MEASSTHTLVAALKAELKASGITYARLAQEMGMSESTIKRVFAREDMPLSRIDEVLRVLKMDFIDLARRVAASRPQRTELTLAQEQAVMADRRLLLMVACCLSQWSVEEIVATYKVTEAEVVKSLAALDRLGVIELRPMNRYRLKVAKTLRWHPHGPVMRYFRETMVPDYYLGGFAGEAELLMMVHGQLGTPAAAQFNERLTRIAEDFAQQHLLDHHLPQEQRKPFTLMIGMRSWIFSAFREMKRDDASALPVKPARAGR